MIVLDAYALGALLLDEPAAAEVEAVVRDDAAISSVNLAEALDVALRIHGLPVDRVQEAVEPLLATSVAVLWPTEREAWGAAHIRARYYHRRENPLSLADCLLLATAADTDGVATADPGVARAARDEGIRVIALPDSSGARP